MSRLTLNRLKVENFKGIKSFVLGLNGGNMEIVAENGVGKTTVFDAFWWLFFGKDSTGRTDSGTGKFEIHTLDRYNEPVKGLVVAVEAEVELECDGGIHEVNTFRKESHEKFVKKQSKGYETHCWIGGVSRSVTEYQNTIKNIIAEDRFKLLTDLTYFCEKFHWTDRRAVLLEMAGEIEQPEGFDELLEAAGNRNLDDYKKVLSDEKKRYSKERDEINPRIDEILKGVEQPGNIDVEALKKKRDALRKNMDLMKKTRQDVLDSEQARQKTINEINRLEVEKRKRETDLMKPDPKKTAELKEQRSKLQQELRASDDARRKLDGVVDSLKQEKESAESSLKIKQRNLADIRTEYAMVSENKESDVCYNCGQKLPDKKLKGMAEKKAKRLAEIEKQGNGLKGEIDSIKDSILSLEAEIQTKQTGLEIAEADYKFLEAQTEQKLKAIDRQLADVPAVDPKEDKVWLKLNDEIDSMREELGEPASEQLKAINDHLDIEEAEMQKVNTQLAAADRLEKDSKRVQELKARNQELSQLITDCEKYLEQIQEYKMEQAKAVTEAVNGMFDIVEFKMFNIRLNESIEECCEATLNGVPYSDLSTGQKIIVGLDIINTLSSHYGFSAPLFIDHAESLTYEWNTQAQVILLYARNSYAEKVIQTDGTIKEIYHDYSKLTVESVSKQKVKAVA